MTRPPTCYSDHNHDIDVIGDCSICGGTDREGAQTGEHIRTTAPVTPLSDVLPYCRALLAGETSVLDPPIIDGAEVMVDALTAQAVCVVFDALKPENQATAGSIGFMRFADFSWKHVTL